MKITFLGVGEACDAQYPNTSILVAAVEDAREHVLLDCGFTTPHVYFKSCSDPEALLGVWISHFHGDHFFGMPLLLLRLSEMGREKPLLILGPESIQQKIEAALELAYPGVGEQLGFPVDYLPVEPGKRVEATGFQWKSAKNHHSQSALSVLIRTGQKSVLYSGDGGPTPESLALAKGCDLVIHEAFCFEGEMSGHGSVSRAVEFAQKAGAPQLALVHIQRSERESRKAAIMEYLFKVKGCSVFLPEPGTSVKL